MDKTAVIYARVSTTKQADEELPISGQVERCQQKAADLDAAVLQVFTDDGLSGRSDARPAFQEALFYCEAYQPDYFIVWSSSRFARNRADAAFNKRRLDRAGVRLVYVSMEVDTGTDAGWLLDGVMEIFDEWYSRQISSDTRRSMVRNAHNGYWAGGRPPFGYRPEPAPEDPKRKRLVPEPAEAEVVREIFDLRANGGVGALQIAQLLNERGITNRGKRWNKTVIGYLLRNEAVIGQTVFGRKSRETGRRRPREHWIVVDSHEPVVPRDLWDRVQMLIDHDAENAAASSTTSQHVFTGLLTCGHCGSGMQTESAKGRSKRYWYYNCRAARLEQKHTPFRFPAPEVDEYLVEQICEVVLSPESLREVYRELQEAVAGWQVEHSQRRQRTLDQLQQVERRNSNLYEILELYGKDAPNLGDLTRRMRANNEEVKRLEQELARIEAEERPELRISDADLVEFSETLVDVVKTSASPKKLRSFFASFVQRVILEPDGHLTIEYDPQKIINRPGGAVRDAVVWLPETVASRTRRRRVPLPPHITRSRGGSGFTARLQ